jgi:hypothetical protein
LALESARELSLPVVAEAFMEPRVEGLAQAQPRRSIASAGRPLPATLYRMRGDNA